MATSTSAMWSDVRERWGEILAASRCVGAPVLPSDPELLTEPSGQVKLRKGFVEGVMTWALQLSPAWESGRNLCAWAGACADSCIKGTGQNAFGNAENARRWRTVLYLGDRPTFNRLLDGEIGSRIQRAERLAMVPAFRLNALSDVNWRQTVERWSDRARFYDYTKSIGRAERGIGGPWDLTYSWSEKTDPARALELLRSGGKVAVVFAGSRSGELPSRFLRFPVVDGDRHDVRFLDRPGSVIGLRFKAARNRAAQMARAFAAGFAVEAGATLGQLMRGRS